MKAKDMPADTIPNTNDNLDVALRENKPKMYIFKCTAVKTGRGKASRLCLFIQYGMLAEEASCNKKTAINSVGCAKQRRLLAKKKLSHAMHVTTLMGKG
jgi:hypothetical protein